MCIFSFLQFQWLNHRTFFFSPDVLIERGLLAVVRIWPLPFLLFEIWIGQRTINDRNAFVSTLWEHYTFKCCLICAIETLRRFNIYIRKYVHFCLWKFIENDERYWVIISKFYFKMHYSKTHILYLGNMNLSHFRVGGVAQSLYHTSWVATISLGGWKSDPQLRPIRGRLLISFRMQIK